MSNTEMRPKKTIGSGEDNPAPKLGPGQNIGDSLRKETIDWAGVGGRTYKTIGEGPFGGLAKLVQDPEDGTTLANQPAEE